MLARDSEVSDDQELELDMEWVELIKEAKRLGLTIEVIRQYIQETKANHE